MLEYITFNENDSMTILTLRARTVFKIFWKNAGSFAVLVCCAAAN